MRLMLLNKCNRKFTSDTLQYSVIFTYTDEYTDVSYNFLFDLYKVNEYETVTYYLVLRYNGIVQKIFKCIMSHTELKGYFTEYDRETNCISSSYLVQYLEKYFTQFSGLRILRTIINRYAEGVCNAEVRHTSASYVL